jgi:H+/Cl- antiporter ClcA
MPPQESALHYGTTDNDEARTKSPQVSKPPNGMAKTKDGFASDFKNFAEGSLPQSILVALVIGVVCGVAANVYYKIMEASLEAVWHEFPKRYIIDVWPEWAYVLWIPIVGFTFALGSGMTVKYMGEPGDLAYTVKCVHESAYIAMDHVMPMVCASQFGIMAGGSLGPEAPLVAICAALGGFVSRTVFKRTNRNIVRKHTLMGMAGALAAFFGSPLGGSMFALEVNSRFGVEYFEHMIEAIFCGEVTLAVFRTCAGLPIAPIWEMPTILGGASGMTVLIGAGIGLLGAGVAALFATFHGAVMGWFKRNDLLNNENAPQRAMVGAIVVVFLGMLIPHTMFWGEYEFQTIATMAPASTLNHIWPTTGLIGFEMENAFHCFIVGFAKLIAISFTVAGGYRGGFIFPFFAAGAALGRCLHCFIPAISVPLACLSFAAAINVAITRTSLATPIILCFLSAEQNAMSGVLAASLVSLFATTYMPFLKTQVPRADLEFSLFANLDTDPEIKPEEHAHEDEPEKLPLV